MEAIKRQVDTAIELWFKNGDPIAIHTLAAAACSVTLNLCEHKGLKPPIPFDMSLIKPGMEIEFKRIFKRAENFFKHADKDPDAKLDFNPKMSEGFLIGTIESFHLLTGSRTLLMTAFRSRYFAFHPHIAAVDFVKPLTEFLGIDPRSLSRQDFLRVFARRRSALS